MSLAKSHHDLDRMEADAIRRDLPGWLTAAHEGAHIIAAITSGTPFVRVELQYRNGVCIGGAVTGADHADRFDHLFFLAAGLACEHELYSHLIADNQILRAAAGDLEQAQAIIGFDPMRHGPFLRMIGWCRDDARELRDAVVAIALQLWDSPERPLSQADCEEIFEFACKLP